MTKDSPEYKKHKAEHDAKEKYKSDHPEEYPWCHLMERENYGQ